ncbi:hypothetical protein V1264_001118 [Littorina saxatilis]|uniref:Uncharacterized protein n=1 Tax=Littorina saxatilis TaxID=31220 RepID=A0AAN9BYS4_9CAEN
MASLQGQMAGGDVSDVIYSQIMNMSSSCPRSKRSSSAKSVGISFPAAPRNRSRSKTSPGNNQASYTDFDILKSRSWSESKLRSTSPVKTSALGRNTQRSSRSLLVSPALPRSALVSLTTRSATAVSYTTQHSTTVTRTACGSRGLTTPRRGLACGGSLTFGMKESALQAGATQIDRLQQEWAALEHCRAMKRASEMVQHRLNPMYRLSGSPVPLLQRYEVDDMELQRLREMTETNRTLQHDLKRIKFPHTGPRTPRKERNKSRGKSQQRHEAGTANTDDDAVNTNNTTTDNNTHGGETKQQPGDMEMSPGPDVMHPPSPVSSPPLTPRPYAHDPQQEELTQQEHAEQGELIHQETTEQGEASRADEGEVNPAGEEEEEVGDEETQEWTEAGDA